MNDESRGLLFGLAGVTAFGLTLPITRHLTPYLDPVFIGLGRAVLAAAVAALVLAVTRSPLPRRDQLLKLATVAGGVVVGFPVLSAWAMNYVPAAHGGVVLGILPLATAVTGSLVSGDRPSTGFWSFSVLGSVLVVVYALIDGAGHVHPADLALLGAVICAAVGYAVGGQLARSLGGPQVICWALLVALPFIAWPAWLARPLNPGSLPVSVSWGFLYLALVSQLLGFFWWNRGLALGGIARVSQTQLLQPFVTLVASALLLSERLSLATLGFAVAVVACVAAGRRTSIYRQPRGT